MPISVDILFQAVLGRNPEDSIKWGDRIDCRENGVYVVSYKRPITSYDISICLIEAWIEKVPLMMIDGQAPTPEDIKNRLTRFIYSDETILYIGQTTSQSLRDRTNQFYNHILGDPRPHRGGHWIKTLSIMDDLIIHWSTAANPIQVEREMLGHFTANTSPSSREMQFDADCPIPFANLVFNRRKIHGLLHQTL